MGTAGWTMLGLAAAVVLYTLVLYPLALRVLGALRSRSAPPRGPAAPEGEWPRVSITVPAYNEEAQIGDCIETLLALDYPRDRLQIVVVSDASSDRTDEIVRSFAQGGVQLHRMETRGGKTRAENAVAPLLTGDIVVNTDASIRLHRDALRRLTPWFADPTVGVASGRDVSVGDGRVEANVGEGGYVGYEMHLRRLETRVGGIVGNSGSLYAIRPELHRIPHPEHLSRDFASALVARRAGFRSISVDDAVCFVPRTPSLQREYRRKIRTISRGIQTLFHNRDLLNPLRYGTFAWMLWSHKVARWLLPVSAAVALLGFLLLALAGHLWALAPLAGALVGGGGGGIAWRWPGGRAMPRWISLPAFLTLGNVAVLVAWLQAFRPAGDPTWEPTRREPVKVG